VREDDPAGGRSGDGLDLAVACPVDDRGRETFGLARMLQHLELLEIAG
jgi:hypothetical protein